MERKSRVCIKLSCYKLPHQNSPPTTKWLGNNMRDTSETKGHKRNHGVPRMKTRDIERMCARRKGALCRWGQGGEGQSLRIRMPRESPLSESAMADRFRDSSHQFRPPSSCIHIQYSYGKKQLIRTLIVGVDFTDIRLKTMGTNAPNTTLYRKVLTLTIRLITSSLIELNGCL
jgi:hypothetical protein